MVTPSEWTAAGHAGELVARTWGNDKADWLAILVHGYGEHIGRYQHVADTLAASGALVVGHDHAGHGRSAGERVHIEDFDRVVEDEHEVVTAARAAHPDLRPVLIGHSLDGMIATRYTQQHPDQLDALVLSGPVLGRWKALDLLGYERMPQEPIDPAALSRDPAVGAAYAADELVWHGGFKRETLAAIASCLATINAGEQIQLPSLWLHGDDDDVVPKADTRTGIDHIRGPAFEETNYAGARHEIFNEMNSAEVLADLTAFVRRALG